MDFIRERYELMKERIREIPTECKGNDELWGFSENAERIMELAGGFERVENGKDPLKELDSFYANILPPVYGDAVENPAYAVRKLKRKNGQLMAALAASLYEIAEPVLKGDLERLTLHMELLVEMYCLRHEAEEECNTVSDIRNAAYEKCVRSLKSFMCDNVTITADEMLSGVVYGPTVNVDFLRDHEESFALYFDSKYAGLLAEALENAYERRKSEGLENNLAIPESLVSGEFEEGMKREAIRLTKRNRLLLKKVFLKIEKLNER